MVIGHTAQGDRVILDPAVTIQRIYMIFYLCINIGSLTFRNAIHGARCWILICRLACFVHVPCRHYRFGHWKENMRRPTSTDAFQVVWLMIRHRNMNAAKPSYQQQVGGRANLPWDDHFVKEVKCEFVACKVFTFYPIYWVVYGNFSNSVTQSNTFPNPH